MRNKFMQCMYFILSCCVLCIMVSPIFGQICMSTMAMESIDDRTGSPLDVDGDACSECHSPGTELNSGSAIFSISAPETYTPGESVEITVSFENSDLESFPNYGFELTALDANDNNIGTFTPVVGTSTTKSDHYISQSSSGGSQPLWKVLWNAPSTTIDDPVTLYAAGVQGNGGGPTTEGDTEGDYVYTYTLTMSQLSAATPTPTPTPATGGGDGSGGSGGGGSGGGGGGSGGGGSTSTPTPTAIVVVTPTATPTTEPTPVTVATPTLPDETLGVLAGFVTDKDTGEGINGAAVSSLSGIYNTTTDTTGYYQLENISEGIYTFIASAAGYIQLPVSGVAIVEGDTTGRDFTLAAAAIVTPTPPVSNPTPNPTPNPTETSIPSECEVTSIVIFPEEIELKKGQTAEVTVYLITPEGCLPISGEKVKATVKKNKGGKKKVSASPRKTMTIVGETYGEAAFTITAKKKKGTSKVKFKYNNLKTTLKVVLVE
ncbi:MAG: hypothetical protein A2W17_09720 [Planctomycetes bacterium RBG_16_41_13]|nr:MAG: hypothetical protein A2W17_09720 [Planctomycetes bacterium RBG_16_41_13]